MSARSGIVPKFCRHGRCSVWSMGHEDFRPLHERAFRFALDVMRLCRTFVATWEGRHVADQLCRAGTSVAANYRAASRGRSPADFIAKMGLVVEEIDESVFWLSFVRAAAIARGEEVDRLHAEAGELLAIFAASLGTAKANAKERTEARRALRTRSRR